MNNIPEQETLMTFDSSTRNCRFANADCIEMCIRPIRGVPTWLGERGGICSLRLLNLLCAGFLRWTTSQLVPDIATLQNLLKTSNEPAENGRREYPDVAQAWAKVQIVDQEQGETIFIPSNWYHQVNNLTEAVSINPKLV